MYEVGKHKKDPWKISSLHPYEIQKSFVTVHKKDAEVKDSAYVPIHWDRYVPVSLFLLVKAQSSL